MLNLTMNLSQLNDTGAVVIAIAAVLISALSLIGKIVDAKSSDRKTAPKKRKNIQCRKKKH